jgi:hypothetical protein
MPADELETQRLRQRADGLHRMKVRVVSPFANCEVAPVSQRPEDLAQADHRVRYLPEDCGDEDKVEASIAVRQCHAVSLDATEADGAAPGHPFTCHPQHGVLEIEEMDVATGHARGERWAAPSRAAAELQHIAPLIERQIRHEPPRRLEHNPERISKLARVPRRIKFATAHTLFPRAALNHDGGVFLPPTITVNGATARLLPSAGE